ncbi:adenosine deaminase [Pseudovibrio exalbescens]|uniref:adenosine deaminase n=1 Tax=Pseudovibrio exalbescens TaxID=197461 RepID=UPI00236644C3|nr:adenosine deaminase [Pseudovibrio exalbescens]MDD7910063.1 adenosine deaminase [Pseudovibrio exalbescens]
MIPKPPVVPRAELHCHMEGAAPPSLVIQLAERYGVALDGLLDANGNYSWHDFTTFLKTYDVASALFRSPEDFTLLAETYFGMLAAEGAIYGEVFISPDHAVQSGLTYKAYMDAIGEGIMRANEATGIEGRMISTGVRHYGVKAVEMAALTTVNNPHPLLTGFGLAGDEREGHPSNYQKAFKIAQEAGLGLTAHAGEFGGPESVKGVLDFLHVTRIGHGVRSVEDPALVQRIVEEGVTLEVCPGSNIALGVYSNLRFHPVNILRQAGVKITLSSDDPPFFRTTLGHEYSETSRVFGWDRAIQKELTANAIKAAFCDDDTKARLFQQLEEATRDTN